MVRGSKNKKSKKVLLSKKARRKRTRARARDKLVTSHWRGRLTVQENYKRMGLASNPNRNTRGTESNPVAREIVTEMERSADRARKEQESHQMVYIDWHSKQILCQLIEKYGTDYEAMSRDIKLNMWQKTAGQLRRQCQRLTRALS